MRSVKCEVRSEYRIEFPQSLEVRPARNEGKYGFDQLSTNNHKKEGSWLNSKMDVYVCMCMYLGDGIVLKSS